jgi:hypothetical protein
MKIEIEKNALYSQGIDNWGIILLFEKAEKEKCKKLAISFGKRNLCQLAIPVLSLSLQIKNLNSTL